MAAMLRGLGKFSVTCPSKNISLKILGSTAGKVCTVRISSDVALTIADYVEQKREQAKLGGGQRRIDTQHKKVRYFFSCWHSLAHERLVLMKSYCLILVKN